MKAAVRTLDEIWTAFLSAPAMQGKSDADLNDLRTAFFVGAACAYSYMNTAAEHPATFNTAMNRLFEELDSVMTDDLMSMPAEGHA